MGFSSQIPFFQKTIKIPTWKTTTLHVHCLLFISLKCHPQVLELDLHWLHYSSASNF